MCICCRFLFSFGNKELILLYNPKLEGLVRNKFEHWCLGSRFTDKQNNNYKRIFDTKLVNAVTGVKITIIMYINIYDFEIYAVRHVC